MSANNNCVVGRKMLIPSFLVKIVTEKRATITSMYTRENYLIHFKKDVTKSYINLFVTVLVIPDDHKFIKYLIYCEIKVTKTLSTVTRHMKY